MKNQVERFLDEIRHEYYENPEFRARIDRIFGAGSEKKQNSRPERRSRNKRAAAIIDPYREYVAGEEQLLRKLEPLTIDQLRDIVSEYALDSSRLALKWKNKERLIDLIVTTARSRIQKGDVFRGDGKGENKIEGESKNEDDNKAENNVK